MTVVAPERLVRAASLTEVRTAGRLVDASSPPSTGERDVASHREAHGFFSPAESMRRHPSFARRRGAVEDG